MTEREKLLAEEKFMDYSAVLLRLWKSMPYYSSQ